MTAKIKQLFIRYKQIISYLFWGVMTTLVSWGSYSLFILLLPESEYEITVANVLSWICAVLFAFITNKLWVFGSKSFKPSLVIGELGKFVASRLVSGAVEIVGVPLLVKLGLDQKIFGIDGLLAKVLVGIIVVVLNYVLSKLLVFRHRMESEEKNQ